MILVLLGVEHPINFLQTIFDVIPLKVSQITPISLMSQHTSLTSRSHQWSGKKSSFNVVGWWPLSAPWPHRPHYLFLSKPIDVHWASPGLPLPSGYATDTTTAAAHIVLTPHTDADAPPFWHSCCDVDFQAPTSFDGSKLVKM